MSAKVYSVAKVTVYIIMARVAVYIVMVMHLGMRI